MTPTYRPDIDGLRAIAVLSVLFFHAGFSVFGGGYVGVDIFFVISGYLITSIIVREIATQTFSIGKFYERRFRRILPALTVVVLFTLGVGAYLLSPGGVIDLGKSAIATALFSSNMLFYFESGYFDRAAEMKPLLHTWSLAVEEQYYIFFPLLMLGLAKFGRKHYLPWLLVIGGLSFIGCLYYTPREASAAFYWIPTRAWELLIGSILALGVLPTPTQRGVRELLSLVGLAFLGYSIFVFDASTPFPGSAALLPTLGTAMIIYAGSAGKSLVYTGLALRPVVFIGLISYSLYLWHWPVIVYTKLWLIKEPSIAATTMMLLAMFIAAILSWKFVEAPFRDKRVFAQKRPLLLASAAVSTFIAACGLALVVSDGLPQRLQYSQTPSEDVQWQHWHGCENVLERLQQGQGLCTIGAKNRPAEFLFWGDSHARALASGVDASSSKFEVGGQIASQSACPPLLGIDRPNRKSCAEFNQSMLSYIETHPEIHTVVLAARWALSTEGNRYKQEHGKPVSLRDAQDPANDSLDNAALFAIGLERTLVSLEKLGKRVVLVSQIPEVGYDVPSAHVIADITQRDLNQIIAPSRLEYQQRNHVVAAAFNQATSRSNIKVIEPQATLCDQQLCRVADAAAIFYRDDNHLSTLGSEHVASVFDPLFKEFRGAQTVAR